MSMYNMDSISKLSQGVSEYEILDQHGTGVMEDPHSYGRVIRTLECSEFDAFIISAYMNMERYGIISVRSSWESPMVTYREKKVEPEYTKLSMERIAKVISEVFPNCKEGEENYIGPIGNSGMFQIGPGVSTGLMGWNIFNEALRKAAKEMYDEQG